MQVCVTLEDWEAFPFKFAKTKDRNERALRDYVQFDILPLVVAALQVRLSFFALLPSTLVATSLTPRIRCAGEGT